MIYEKLFFLLQIFLLQGSYSSKNLVVAISAEKKSKFIYIMEKRNDINSNNNKNAVQHCDAITE